MGTRDIDSLMFQEWLSTWRQDSLLRRVLQNSSYLFSSSVISAVLAVFIIRLLSPENYGLATIIMVFTSNVNRFLSFRMSEVVVKYVGEALAQDNKDRATALIKAIGITEAITSVLAYLVLVALSLWAANVFAKDVSTVPLFIFYGLFLLANLVYETSVGVLQTTNHFNDVARANFFQSIATFILIFITFILKRGIFEVLAAYVVGKTVAGVIVTSSAFQEVNRKLGKGWTHVPLSLPSDWRSIGTFMLS